MLVENDLDIIPVPMVHSYCSMILPLFVDQVLW